jgi:hypothetical protein
MLLLINRNGTRSFLNFVENAVVHERNSHLCTREFGKGALAATFQSAAVLQSERGKRLEVGGRRQKIKCQSSNDKVPMERSLGERKNEL